MRISNSQPYKPYQAKQCEPAFGIKFYLKKDFQLTNKILEPTYSKNQLNLLQQYEKIIDTINLHNANEENHTKKLFDGEAFISQLRFDFAKKAKDKDPELVITMTAHDPKTKKSSVIENKFLDEFISVMETLIVGKRAVDDKISTLKEKMSALTK